MKPGLTRAYLLRRLARDHPDILARYERGEFTHRHGDFAGQVLAEAGPPGAQDCPSVFPMREAAMVPVSLSDSALRMVMDAAAPLEPHDRSSFLADVASELARHPEPGDGDIHRAIAAIQKKYFRPPDLARRAGAGKWQ